MHEKPYNSTALKLLTLIIGFCSVDISLFCSNWFLQARRFFTSR